MQDPADRPRVDRDGRLSGMRLEVGQPVVTPGYETAHRARYGARMPHQPGPSRRSRPGDASTKGPPNASPTNAWSSDSRSTAAPSPATWPESVSPDKGPLTPVERTTVSPGR